jgi:Flp pilus assembly protein TadG
LAAEERGSSAVELVILFPVTLFVVLLIVQFGIWYHAAAVARAAAQQGVKASSALGGSTADGLAGADRVLREDGRGILVAPTVTPVETGGTARVIVSARALSIVPVLDLPIRTSAQAPLERYRPAGP